MAKIRVVSEGSWYYELQLINSYTETKYEEMVFHHAKAIFPDFITIQYKKTVSAKSIANNKTPDIALIRSDYKEWWIVEVELSRHPIEHVREQIEVFLNGNYNSLDVSEYLIQQIKKKYSDKKIFQKKIEDLVTNSPPKVLIVVDSNKDIWEKEFNRIGVEVCVFEIYKNSNARYSYRLYGNYPFIISKESLCHFEKQLNNNTLFVETESIFEGKTGRIEIEYDGFLTRWDILSDKKHLKFIGIEPPLNSMNDFVLVRSSKNKFFLRRN